jgi:hypothetical protein
VTAERPTFGQCVIGYREWKLDDGWLLRPITADGAWRPGVNHARCRRGTNFWLSTTTAWSISATADPEADAEEHEAPASGCDCGLYALHDPPDLTFDRVLGAVAAWGNLEVHSSGFRAEYAQVVALVLPTRAQLTAAGRIGDGPDYADPTDAARIYGVPLVALEDLRREAERHGEPLPRSARPEPELLLGEWPVVSVSAHFAVDGRVQGRRLTYQDVLDAIGAVRRANPSPALQPHPIIGRSPLRVPRPTYVVYDEVASWFIDGDDGDAGDEGRVTMGVDLSRTPRRRHPPPPTRRPRPPRSL